MGLIFQDSETRNPTNQTSELPKIDHCAELRKEYDLMNQFLEDNGYAVLFDHYKYLIENPDLATGAEVMDDTIDFEEIG